MTHPWQFAWQAVGVRLATLYKARGVPVKQPVCAICGDRTRGRTQQLRLRYGVAVWLCGGHGAAEFTRRNGGRDLVATLMRLWQAHGCLTAARNKALEAHLAAVAGTPLRPRPGGYAWPVVRRRAEALFAAGAALEAVTSRIGRAEFGVGRGPSRRTIARWRSERRWAAAAGPAP